MFNPSLLAISSVSVITLFASSGAIPYLIMYSVVIDFVGVSKRVGCNSNGFISQIASKPNSSIACLNLLSPMYELGQLKSLQKVIYIFYPLSVNKSIIKFGKKVREKGFSGLGRRIPVYVPMFFVWILTGMWHGSESRFVVWGLCNYVFIVLGTELEGLSSRIVMRLGLKEAGLAMKSYRAFKTFWLMSFLRLFDINKTPKEALNAFKYIFTGWSGFDPGKIYEQLSLPYEDFVVAIIAIIVLFAFEMIQRKGSVRKRIFALPTPLQWVVLSVLIVAVSVFGYYGPGYDAASFIYGAY